MYRRIAAFAAAGLLLSGQAAYAAQGARVMGVTGSVLVSQNGRFVPASNGAALRAGDRIVATNGSARVLYGDGCSVAVSARSMVTIGAASPCVGGSSGVVRVSRATPNAEESSSEESSSEESSTEESWSTQCGGIYTDIYTNPDSQQTVKRDVCFVWGHFLAYGVVAVATTAKAIKDDSDPVSP